MQMPELLQPGDTVAILATSGPCDGGLLAKGVEALKALGLIPWVMESCHKRHGYLAGPDDLRLRDLHTAFAASKVRGIFVARGGYGAQRLLPKLDLNLIRRNPKVFVGYSDVTALHTMFNQHCELITFHGPMPAVDLARANMQFTTNALKKMIFATLSPGCMAYTDDNPGMPHKRLLANPPGQPFTTIVPGRAVGPLTGGNLCLLAASIGTPYEIDTRGRILFMEETGEDPYRIDRMLLQLKLAGKLADAAGIVLGDCSPQTLETMHIPISELIAMEGKPTLAGLACGHTSYNLTLPLGQTVELNATYGEIEVLGI